MSLPATIRVNPSVPFPAKVNGGPGISVTKQNGTYTVTLNIGALASITADAVTNPGQKSLMILDTATGVNNQMTLNGLGDALFKLTSTSSLAIGAGSVVFVTQPNKDLGIGSWIIATSNANPTTNYMVGQVTAYDSLGNLTVSVPSNGDFGTGTHADWTIRPGSPPGTQSISGATQHGIVIATGPTSAGSTAAPTAGQILVGQGATSDPSLVSVSGDATLAANGALTITAGVLKNTRLAKTAAYSVANADKGSTIALGGAAFYTLTFAAASGYDANFAVMVVNEDTARAKQISLPSGMGSFRLYPLQSVVIFNQNNVWQVHGRQRWFIPSTTVTIFVDPAGSDSNDGLASGSANAFLTPGAALLEALRNYDLAAWGGALTISLAAGTYNGSAGVDMIHYSGRNVGAQGGAAILITGATGVAANVVLIANGANVFSINTGAIVSIQNLTVGTTNGGGGGSGVACDSLSKVYLTNVSFQWCDGNHMWSSNDSVIEIDGNIQIIGSGGPSGHGGAGGAHIRASSGGVITNGAAFTLAFNSGTNADFTWFALSSGMGNIAYAPTIVINAFAVTGQRYQAQFLSLINTGSSGNVNFFPGNSAGAAVTGSIYN